MARTKQTARPPARKEVHVLRVDVSGKKPAGCRPVVLVQTEVQVLSVDGYGTHPASRRPAASVRTPHAARSVRPQPKKVSPQDVFNCNDMMRELESAAISTLANVFDCSQLRDALEYVPTAFPKDIQGTRGV